MPYIQRAAWSQTAEKGLQIAARGDMDFIRWEVEQGIAALFECKEGADRMGWVVLRYEREADEMVLVAGEGKGFHRFVPIIEQYSRNLGAKTIRTHIERPGLKRWYESIDWSQREIVMSKAL
ncbi:hypothetical protein HBA55_34530 [Pseudomaricurvus alkylphenolicus]|uniref:hypothetical protein n=1 Tax=Pseudomaricurvus alkylphenolicus TaxID=1306991 RepID=UPI00141F902C|nr:hypothetical protein [Pseudomaricurvus alkylphenolicus]NIB44748.1 hypothetical protein [Pseudomaricurvus alkylphenolicus]